MRTPFVLRPARAWLALVVIALSSAVVIAAACATATKQGAIVGRIVYSGGPPRQQQSATAQPGRVTVRSRSGIVAVRLVRRGQRFHISLRPGRYRVAAHSGDGLCRSVRVHVRAKQTSDVDIVCSVR